MSLCRDVPIGPGLITSQAGASPSCTAMGVAWNIPIIACTSWTRGSGENAKAVLVDLLEGESGTISSEIPTIVMGSVLPSNPAAAGA